MIIYKIINSPVALISGIETEYTKKIPNENTPKDEYKNYCWERVKDEDCSWECITEKYLISKNDQRNLIAKKQAKQNKKVDDSAITNLCNHELEALSKVKPNINEFLNTGFSHFMYGSICYFRL